MLRCRGCGQLRLRRRSGATRRHVALYLLGPAVVCCGVAAASFMISEGCRHVLPHKAPAWRPVHLACMAILALNFFFNYSHAVMTDAGTPARPAYARLLREASEAGLVSAADHEAQLSGSLSLETLAEPGIALRRPSEPFRWSFCRRSGLLKPPRAHFDGVTEALVLNFDHYCVWLFNAVGHGNYRYFILTVLQLWLAAVFGLVETVGPFLSQRQAWLELNATLTQGLAADAGRQHSARQAVLVSRAADEVESLWVLLLLCAVCILVIGHFAGWHLWHCVLNNRTTIETYAEAQRRRQSAPPATSLPNAYDWGSRQANWAWHFGGRGIVASVLIPSRAPPPWPPYPCPTLVEAQRPADSMA
eukprot:COSAG04_NODE_2460_length_4086_cov_3.975671_1_plen_361_part_00